MLFFFACFQNPLLSAGRLRFKKKKTKENLDQFLTYRKANLGPVFNFTAYIYMCIYKYIHIYIHTCVFVRRENGKCRRKTVSRQFNMRIQHHTTIQSTVPTRCSCEPLRLFPGAVKKISKFSLTCSPASHPQNGRLVVACGGYGMTNTSAWHCWMAEQITSAWTLAISNQIH